MGLRDLFWTGPKCSRCGCALEEPTESIPPKNRELVSVLRCRACGSFICEYCQAFGLTVMSGCPRCRKSHFIGGAMWVRR
jgi:hypothetical protein